MLRIKNHSNKLSWRHVTANRYISSSTSIPPPPPPPVTLGGIDSDLSIVNHKEIDRLLSELGPFPSYLSILNQRHFYQNEILINYSKRDPHPVSLRQLAGYGKRLTKQKILASANFVRMELPIRLSMRIRDLQTLPFGMVNNFHMTQIYESYYHLFNAFRKIQPITTTQQNDQFCETLLTLLDDHVFNLPHLMMGALEVSILSNKSNDGGQDPHDLDKFMSVMLRLRLSRRVIVEEHLLLTENYKLLPNFDKPADFIGEIFAQCNAQQHLQQVAHTVRESMKPIWPDVETMPAVEIDGDVNTTFPFMIPHLHYLFGEILRNSYQATILKAKEGHNDSSNSELQQALSQSGKLPPIRITVVNSPHEITFRISDQGGGIPHEHLSNIFSFAKSPNLAKQSLANFHRIPGLQLHHNLKVTPAGSSIVDPSAAASQEALFSQTSLLDHSDKLTSSKQSTLSSLVGRAHEHKFGLGLPMCRVYADYWNGNLLMDLLEGYGTDTCLTLKKLGYHSNVLQLDRA